MGRPSQASAATLSKITSQEELAPGGGEPLSSEAGDQASACPRGTDRRAFAPNLELPSECSGEEFPGNPPEKKGSLVHRASGYSRATAPPPPTASLPQTDV